MKLSTNMLFIIAYPWYIAHTLVLRCYVLADLGYISEYEKEEIALFLQLRWSKKHFLEQLFYAILCTLIYFIIYCYIKY